MYFLIGLFAGTMIGYSIAAFMVIGREQEKKCDKHKDYGFWEVIL